MDCAPPGISIHSGNVFCDFNFHHLIGRNPVVAQKCWNSKNDELLAKHASCDILGVSSKIGDELVTRELGKKFHKMLQVNDSSEDILSDDSPSNREESCSSSGTRIFQDIDESTTFDAKVGKVLNKSVTFPISNKVQSYPEPIKREDGLPGKLCDIPNSSFCESHVYGRSMSLSPSSKLVSAMKGGRERSGISQAVKLHVKWAPEVYDPPVTSMSHSVKSHRQQCPKARKRDQHKHKHKGKSSRSNAKEKKYTRRTFLATREILSK
ncbi:uncharacterized protein LOC120273616 isoform X2 [Dioscorea cayenensis subsp. rotundata]|nr:uncharacterized protein LOC120273616 isoform X2 [Dioscorea cayenensis subsp. rotundata]